MRGMHEDAIQDGKGMYSPNIISPCSGKMGGTIDLVDFYYGRKDRLDEPSHPKRSCYLHQTKTATSYQSHQTTHKHKEKDVCPACTTVHYT